MIGRHSAPKAAVTTSYSLDDHPNLLIPKMRELFEAFRGRVLALDPCVTEEFRPCLLSADLHAWHILVEERGGALRVSGHIDLGDVEVGPVEYEWVPLCQKAFRGNEAMMRAFFGAYTKAWTAGCLLRWHSRPGYRPHSREKPWRPSGAGTSALRKNNLRTWRTCQS